MEINFVHPAFLLLLIGIPLLIMIHFVSIKFSKKRSIAFANFEAISRIKGIDLYSKNIVSLILSCFLIVFLSLSAAEMHLIAPLQTSQNTYIIAIDSSSSMTAADILPNRLEAARNSANAFIDSTPIGTRIGIIGFSGQSFVEQPIIDDKEILKNAINSINISFVGGTNMDEAIITSANLMQNEKNGKILIVLSDGESNAGVLQNSLDYAKKNYVIIDSIGVGTLSGGNTSYGSLSTLDENSMKALAYNTGGKYFNVANEKDLVNSFNSILQLKQGNVDINLSGYLIILAVLVFILEYLAVNMKMFP